MRAAIVGAGPAGFYAAQALLKRFPQINVDILEQLPVPFGLIRYGVAPDHSATKNVISQFSQLVQSNRSRINFYGNIRIHPNGPLSSYSLKQLYDVTIFATGAKAPRQLNHLDLPQRRVYSAHDFIMWMNAHPYYHNQGIHAQRIQFMKQDLLTNGHHIGVIGIGNVAIDIARLLLRCNNDLKTTDISPSAFEVLSNSNINSVSLIGRKSPQHAAWTTAALREVITKIPGITTFTDHHLIQNDLQSTQLARNKQRSLKLLSQKTKHFDNLHHLVKEPTDGNNLFLHFLRTPSNIISNHNSVQVQFSVSQQPSSQLETIDFKTLFLSIGYLPGSTEQGYRVGWANENARGIIGDNKWDAETVVAALEISNTGNYPGIQPWIKESSVDVVTWEGWQRIDTEEKRRGKELGRLDSRVKIESIDEMLQIASDSSLTDHKVHLTNNKTCPLQNP